MSAAAEWLPEQSAENAVTGVAGTCAMPDDPSRTGTELAADALTLSQPKDPAAQRSRGARRRDFGSGETDVWSKTFYHRAVQTTIGRELRQQFRRRPELPHRLLTLLMQLNEEESG